MMSQTEETKLAQDTAPIGSSKLLCAYCGNELDDEEAGSPRSDKSGDIMCDECYEDHYRLFCPLCENSFDKALKAEDYFFVITKEAAKELNLEPGIYRTKEWPFFHGDILGGFGGFFPETIEPVRAIDIQSMLKKIYGHKAEVMADEICHDCVDRFTRTSKFAEIRKKYIDRWMRVHATIYERGIIAAGA